MDDLRGYSRVLDSQGNATEKIKDKEKYHYVDALGYGAQHVPEYDETEMFSVGAINYFEDRHSGISGSEY